MRPRVLLAAVLTAAVLVTTAVAASVLRASPDPDPTDPPLPAAGAHSPTAGASAPRGGDPPAADPTSPALASPTAEPLVDPDPTVTVSGPEFLTWAARDRTTGVEVASDNAAETSSTESMIKVWIVADFLRRLAEDGHDPTERELRGASLAIRDSHNGTAEAMYRAGGGYRVVERMIDICGLTDTYSPVGDEEWWSRTEMSARDAVRLGECTVDGRAAGPEWTEWLLAEMRQVRGSTAPQDQRPEDDFEGGRWGIIDGLPDEVADEVSIKNGWTRIGRTDSWHLNCLAVTDEWVMAVMMRYPAEQSLDRGASWCAEIAAEVIGHRLSAASVTGAT